MFPRLSRKSWGNEDSLVPPATFFQISFHSQEPHSFLHQLVIWFHYIFPRIACSTKTMPQSGSQCGRSLEQQHQPHQGTSQKCNICGPTPDLKKDLWGWGPATCVFNVWDDSDSHQSLRRTKFQGLPLLPKCPILATN